MDWKECVQRMIDYIEGHLREDLTLNAIAAQVGYSQFYCSKAARVWGLRESIKGTLGGVIAAWINDRAKAKYVWGVEMPAEFSGPVPEGFECYLAKECDYVKFSHPDEEQSHEAITEAVWNVSETWDPKAHGWEWNDADNPVYEDDREDEGYMVIKPIMRI